MPIGTIIEQPSANALRAAYRPVIIRVAATKTGGAQIPPIVYCDIYFNDVFYKTMSLTRHHSLGATNSIWQFDIQDAAQEYLTHFLTDNGEGQIKTALPIIVRTKCRLRSSGVDSNGFIVPENTAPIQGTLDTDPVSGTGTATNEFYILNVVLQHEDNQTLVTHLNAWRFRTWSANSYPLTHRPDHYKVCVGDSDSYPIVTDKNPTGLRLHYLLRDSSVWQETDSECVPVQIVGSTAFPDATEDVPYSFEMQLTGSAPFSIDGIPTKPAWMTIAIVDDTITFTGTPNTSGTGFPISFRVENCAGDSGRDVEEDINVIAAPTCTAAGFSGSTLLPDATEAVPYAHTVSLTGTPPFTLTNVTKPAWMAINATDNSIMFSGTPGSLEIGEDIEVSFDIENCTSDVLVFNEVIDVNPLGLGIAVEIKVAGSELSICSNPSIVGYTTSGHVSSGLTVYTESALIHPIVGSTFILEVGVGSVYNLNPSTGLIGSPTGNTC